MLIINELEGRKEEHRLKKGGEFVLDGLSPGADQDHETVHDPGDATAWSSGIVAGEPFLLPDIFVRLRIDDERQAVTGRRLHLSRRHLLLPDTKK